MGKKARTIYTRRVKRDRRTRQGFRHLGEATLWGGEGRWGKENRK